MGRFEGDLERSAEKTNTELASDISKITRLKNEQIQELCPEKADKERLKKLIEIVNSATDDNGKILQFKENIEEFAGITLRLIKNLL